ncbi:hypothetical protein TSUD_63370 [Trifolium subterraneum]|uniref:Uncharacterized protein n=1 Tax=Trifolium subterraneum TaxID=3900 RepID=A0A2Z6MTN0_TRISU|nr:hypothetical protein TSUD_63370 [Trifolium subterraneum]
MESNIKSIKERTIFLLDCSASLSCFWVSDIVAVKGGGSFYLLVLGSNNTPSAKTIKHILGLVGADAQKMIGTSRTTFDLVVLLPLHPQVVVVLLLQLLRLRERRKMNLMMICVSNFQSFFIKSTADESDDDIV